MSIWTILLLQWKKIMYIYVSYVLKKQTKAERWRKKTQSITYHTICTEQKNEKIKNYSHLRTINNLFLALQIIFELSKLKKYLFFFFSITLNNNWCIKSVVDNIAITIMLHHICKVVKAKDFSGQINYTDKENSNK